MKKAFGLVNLVITLNTESGYSFNTYIKHTYVIPQHYYFTNTPLTIQAGKVKKCAGFLYPREGVHATYTLVFYRPCMYCIMSRAQLGPSNRH